MYPDSPGSPDSQDCRRLLHGTTADDPFLTTTNIYPSKMTLSLAQGFLVAQSNQGINKTYDYSEQSGGIYYGTRWLSTH